MGNGIKNEVLTAALEGVDKEHDMICEILKKIRYSYTDNLGSGLKKRLIKELYLFLDFHFTSEENLLAIFDYPDYDRHKKEHDDLRHKLGEIMGSMDIEDIDYKDLEQFVSDWLKLHTKHADAHLTEFLKAQYKLQ